MSFGIFIEPIGELKNHILRWKEKVNNELVDQNYCSHPPHSTLIYTNISNYSEAIKEIKKEVNLFSSFSIKVKSNGVFWDDESTSGGHTLIWQICQTSQLNKLQLLIANTLKPIIIVKSLPKNVRANPELSQSYKLYGYPFVGSHWIPHFTIASINVSRGHHLIKEFLNDIGEFEMMVNEVSCWDIEKEQHIILDRIALK